MSFRIWKDKKYEAFVIRLHWFQIVIKRPTGFLLFLSDEYGKKKKIRCLGYDIYFVQLERIKNSSDLTKEEKTILTEFRLLNSRDKATVNGIINIFFKCAKNDR